MRYVVLAVALVNLRVLAASPAVGLLTVVGSLIAFVVLIALFLCLRAVACRIAGFSVLRLQIGDGGAVLSGSLWGCTIEVHRQPIGGHLVAGTAGAVPPVPGLRARIAVVSGLPALAIVGLVVATLRLLPPEARTGPIMLAVFCGLAAVVSTLTVVGKSELELAEARELLGCGAFVAAHLAGQRQQALAVGATTVRTLGLDIGASAVLAELGRHREALDRLLPWYHAPMSAKRQAIFLNNLAWSAAHVGDPQLLWQADEWSHRALSLAGRNPEMAGTRGRVLLELGRPAEALALLARAKKRLVAPAQRAETGASMARALAYLGRPDEAIRELATAQKAAPESEYVRAVARLIGWA
jgi:hypothetical protein